MLGLQRSRISFKSQKSQDFKKNQSQKSTMIEKSIYPFKLGYQFMMKKYLQSQERKQSKFLIQTYVLNRHKFTTELRFQCSQRQCINRYYKNPKAVLRLKTNTQYKKSSLCWFRSRLNTNYRVQKIFEEYKKFKIRDEMNSLNSGIDVVYKQKKIKNLNVKGHYDTSDICLKNLINKIQKMVHKKDQNYEKILDQLSKSRNQNFKNENKCFSDNKKRDSKQSKPFDNIINDYGIQKRKTPYKLSRKFKNKINGRKSLDFKTINKTSKSKSNGSRKSAKLYCQNKQKYDQNCKKLKKFESPYKLEKKIKIKHVKSSIFK